MRIVCISDTHSMHDRLTIPDGHVLVHAGDYSGRGNREALIEFNTWLGTLPHKHKLVIPGNHDAFCEEAPDEARKLLTNATLLLEEGVTIDHVKFWGSPWTPEFCNWSFMYDRATGKERWAKIPFDTDVLITHGPPSGILDTVLRFNKGEYYPELTGCYDLLQRILTVKPKLHIFGHIHEGYGEMVQEGIRFVNASNCNELYRPINKPRVVVFK